MKKLFIFLVLINLSNYNYLHSKVGDSCGLGSYSGCGPCERCDTKQFFNATCVADYSKANCPGKIGQACSNGTCDAGLECKTSDKGVSTCYGKGGSNCSANWQCLSNKCTNGKCESTTGNAGQECNIDGSCNNTNLECIQNLQGKKACYAKEGVACTENWHCKSNNCEGGVCKPAK